MALFLMSCFLIVGTHIVYIPRGGFFVLLIWWFADFSRGGRFPKGQTTPDRYTLIHLFFVSFFLEFILLSSALLFFII